MGLSAAAPDQQCTPDSKNRRLHLFSDQLDHGDARLFKGSCRLRIRLHFAGFDLIEQSEKGQVQSTSVSPLNFSI